MASVSWRRWSRSSAARRPRPRPAIRPGLTRDLYVSLGEAVKPTTWTLRVHVKPFVDWIWAGCLLMAFGYLSLLAGEMERQ